MWRMKGKMSSTSLCTKGQEITLKKAHSFFKDGKLEIGHNYDVKITDTLDKEYGKCHV
jgi:hypothetical protein